MSYLAINSNRPKGSINHTTWAVSERFTPLLALERLTWPADPEPFIPETDGAEWIDIVLNNFDDRGHPFHLHGHDFYVLASHAPSRVGSYDLFNPFDNQPPVGGPLNLLNPLKKDTVYVPSMGYVVLRFRANNPGLWLLHCHVLWHQSVGMGMAFQIGGSSNVDVWKTLRESAHDSCFG
jgi:FtsP/CotA-like multicopper oxidase with cupredoxin domain